MLFEYDFGHGRGRTPDRVFEAIRAYGALRPDEEWVVVYGWDLTLFPETGPTRDQLDRLVPDRPAIRSGSPAIPWMRQALTDPCRIQRAAGANRTRRANPSGRFARPQRHAWKPRGNLLRPPPVLGPLAAPIRAEGFQLQPIEVVVTRRRRVRRLIELQSCPLASPSPFGILARLRLR